MCPARRLTVFFPPPPREGLTARNDSDKPWPPAATGVQTRVRTVALVALGGFAGANARWLLGVFLARLLGAGAAASLLPTLAANVTGAFALGVVLTVAAAGRLSSPTQAVLATGFLSSYTTYSTFAVESALAATPALLAGNVVANYALGFAGAVAGRVIAERLLDSGQRGESA